MTFLFPPRGSTLLKQCSRRKLSASAYLRNDVKGKEIQYEPANPVMPENDTLPPLNRPLGVRQRPTTVLRSKIDRLKDLMDSEALMAQRRHLIKEAGKGYFHDLNMTRKHGGKTWIAPKVLIREDKSLYLPNVSGTALDDGTKKDTTTMCFGKISVVAMLGTKISEAHVKSFTYGVISSFAQHPSFQFIQINLQENLLKSFLVKVYARSLRAQVSPKWQPTYLISSQNMEYLRDPLGMTNSRVGYVYLVDENLKIRWAGSADATLEEAQSLESCTGALLKRLQTKQKTQSKEELVSTPLPV